MGIAAPPSVKYELIDQARVTSKGEAPISDLCEIAGVSRSGYYNWVASAPKRLEKEKQDRADFDLIQQAYQYRGYKKGRRSIYMRLEHQGVRMNMKKISRLMHKFGLKCPYRKANPYRRMAKAMATSNVAPNLLNRKFKEQPPRKVLLTDISYLFYSGGVCYLSTILDVCTHEVLAHQVSPSLRIEFVLETVREMCDKHGFELDDEVIVHSDQGCHYTSAQFIKLLQDKNFVQSMSRKGNCWDNAPQESFFGHMKDEIRALISECKSYEEVAAVVEDWMDYYNNERYQWDLERLAPAEYYTYLMTGVNPLAGLKSGQERTVADPPEREEKA